MELIFIVVFILGIIGWTSNRGQKNSVYSDSTPYVPPPKNLDSNHNRLSDAPRVDYPRYEKASTDIPKASSVTPSPNLSRASSPDDFCNKCGKRWRRWDNSENGGYWFNCSGYPKCDNTRDKQMREKYCSNGHIRTSSNTAYTAAGHRRCLICRPFPERSVAEYSLPKTNRGVSAKNDSEVRKVYSSDDFCRNGHPRTTENTYFRPDGQRECRICRRNARR
jgi:ssDNA-binding Zn-finger/Zn-ribbon topoisomerase 1